MSCNAGLRRGFCVCNNEQASQQTGERIHRLRIKRSFTCSGVIVFQRLSDDRGIAIGFDDVSDIVYCSSPGGNRSDKLSCVTPPHAARGRTSTHLTARVELGKRGNVSNEMKSKSDACQTVSNTIRWSSLIRNMQKSLEARRLVSQSKSRIFNRAVTVSCKAKISRQACATFEH